MRTADILALRNRFVGIRAETSVGDVQMGEALTDATDELTAWANQRQLAEMPTDDFVAFYTELFASAGSC